MLPKFHSIAILLLPGLLLCLACGKEEMPSSGNTVPPLPADERFPINLIVDSATVAGIQLDMTINAALNAAYSTIIAQPAQIALSKSPEPFASVSSTNFSNFSNQANNCKLLALQWLFLYKSKPAEAKPYLDKALSTLLAWVNAGNTATTHIPNESAYLGFYEAYSVIRSRIAVADRNRIDGWLSSRAAVFRNFPPRVNNWETIRLSLLYFSAYPMGNTDMQTYADQAYNTLLQVNLMAGGQSEDLIDRDAFAYHAYNLAFYGRILRAKQYYEGATAMRGVRDKKNSINVSLPDLVNYWKPYLIDPANHVHIEFVNTHYEPDKQRADYNKPYDPASSLYALEELLLAFPEVKGYIEVIPPGGTRYNRKMSGFLYWPRG